METPRSGSWTLTARARRSSRTTDFDGAPTGRPTGSRIAFTSNRDGDHEIFDTDVDGSDETQLTFNGA